MPRDIENRADCEALVRAFYARAFEDPLIGWLFTDVARLDLEAHVPRITSFWETVLLGARSGDYQMPERMDDEWHLHVFDLAGLLAMIPQGLRVTRIEGIPFRWLPLRYVVRCESDGVDRGHHARG